MRDEDLQYAGFISYRRVDPDQKWAKWLHRQLEHFRLPKATVRSYSLESNKVGRFFLDDAETAAERDLPKKIRESLSQSETLVVVCSPIIRDSEWVTAEIGYFEKNHPLRSIPLFLVEGEPAESFPESFIGSLSSDLSFEGAMQPLAADVRGNRWWHVEARRRAVTKIVAAILNQRLGIEFDELWQRELRDIKYRRWFLGVSTTSIAGVVGGLSWWGRNERMKSTIEQERVRRVRAAEALQEVSNLWEKDSNEALSILNDRDRIPEELRDFSWRYFYRLCRPFIKSVTVGDIDIVSLDFSMQSPELLLVASKSGLVQIWNTVNNHRLQLNSGSQTCVKAAISQSGRWVAAAFDTGIIQIWDANDDFSFKLIKTEHTPTALTFRGEQLCLGSNKGILAIWQADSLTAVFETQAAAPVHDLCVSDGTLFGTGEIGVVWKSNPNDGMATKPVGQLDNMHEVNALAVTSGNTGTLIASGGGISAIMRPFDRAQHELHVWGTGDGMFREGLLFELNGHEDSITDIAAGAEDSTYNIFSVSNDGSLRVWDLMARKQVRNLTEDRTFLTSVACTADARYVATGGSNGVVRIWEADGRNAVRIATGGGVVPLNSLAAAKKDHIFATGDDIGRLRLWSSFPLRELAELAPHGPTRFGLCFSADSRFLAAGTRDGKVQIWIVSEKRLSRTLTATWLGLVKSVNFAPEGRLAACGAGGAVVWNSESWVQESAIRFVGGIRDCAFIDNHKLALLCSDGKVRTWDCESRRVLRTISLGHDSAQILAIHPSEPIVAIADVEDGIEIWDISSERLLQRLVGHRKAVRDMEFSPDGKTLASGGFDDRVILWDHVVGVKRSEFGCEDGSVCSVRFLGNGNSLLSAGGGEFGAIEHRIHVWDAIKE